MNVELEPIEPDGQIGYLHSVENSWVVDQEPMTNIIGTEDALFAVAEEKLFIVILDLLNEFMKEQSS